MLEKMQLDICKNCYEIQTKKDEDITIITITYRENQNYIFSVITNIMNIFYRLMSIIIHYDNMQNMFTIMEKLKSIMLIIDQHNDSYNKYQFTKLFNTLNYYEQNCLQSMKQLNNQGQQKIIINNNNMMNLSQGLNNNMLMNNNMSNSMNNMNSNSLTNNFFQ